MNSYIAKHISYLLYYNDCVVIPGFGGIIANYASVEVYPAQNVFSPPSKVLAFNRRLKTNDGLLINHIANIEGKSFNDVAAEVELFVKNLHNTLKEKKLVVLPKIGKFYYDIEQNLQFVADRFENYLLDSFGLFDVQTYPIVRKENITETSRLAFIAEGHSANTLPDGEAVTPKKRKSKAKGVVLTVFVLLLASLLFFQLFIFDIKLSDIKMQYGNLADLFMEKVDNFMDTEGKAMHNKEIADSIREDLSILRRHIKELSEISKGLDSVVFTDNSDTKKEHGKSVEDTIKAAINLTAEKETKKAETTTKTIKKEKEVIVPSGQYHIIVGSFKYKSSARELANKLSKSGNHPQLLKGGLGYRVSINSYSIKSTAEKMVADVKRNYKADAWVLKY